MATPLTDQTAVETALLRPLTPNEATYINGTIDAATSLLRNAAPAVDTRISRWVADPTDLGGVDPQTVSTVLAGAVKRYLINPSGIATETNTVGPYSHSTAYALRSEKETRGVLQITDEDLAVLFPIRKRLRAGTIRTRAALAPRPVGRYGPVPSLDEAIGAEITYARKLPPLLDPLLGDPLIELQ